MKTYQELGNMSYYQIKERFEQSERDLLEQSHQIATLAECLAWISRCDECIEEIEECSRTKRARLSIGNRQAGVARIARLEGLKKQLEERFIHFGGDYACARHSSTAELSWREIDAAFKNRILTGAVINRNYIEPRQFLEDAKDIVIGHIQKVMQEHGSVKVNTMFNGEFVAGEKTMNKSINTRNRELFETSDLQKWFTQYIIEPTLASLDEFQERDSGWALSRILNLTININKHNPMHAGCNVELPREIMLKRAVINVKSRDNACFAWSIVAALHPANNNKGKASSYPNYSEVLNIEGIEFPVSLKQIGKFERNNNMSINVYTIQERKEEKLTIAPIRLAVRKMDKHVNLLYVPDQHDDVGHFTWISDLSRLVNCQINKNRHKKYICERCLHYFYSNEKLDAHTVDCQRLNDCTIILPDEDNKWLSFDKYNRKERIPFIVYVDLECILQQMDNDDNPRLCQHHEVFSIGYYVRCSYDASLSMYRFRRGTDCVTWFIDELKNLAIRMKAIVSTNVSMIQLTPDQRIKFHNATHCHICEKPFASGDDTRVRDHCHLTGQYRGPAHMNCNLNYENSYTIPIVFHNLSGYDSHFIIKELANNFKGEINVLPITKEKYISFIKTVSETGEKKSDSRNHIKLRFIDSLKFLNSSLDKLSSFLNKDKLRIVQSEFSKLSPEDFDLLTRKGVFPYEYVNCAEKLEDTRLPPRESFFSSLTGDTVSESDYTHAENVWKRFSIQTLGEYSDLYLKIDVLLLADVFENFRDSCIKSYGLDPAYYYTLPGFTWDAMLKHTRITFELLTDVDMVLFIERDIRGGLSQCSHRYAQANNKYMRSYDPSKPSSYLMYFDVNNLYGWAMCQPLPYAKFRWVDDVSTLDWRAVAEDSPTGYILEVDLEYPRDLHNAHADLPFCPTRAKPPGKREEKLLATLCDKERYVIHYRNLQQCSRHGLRVKKIHRVLQFTQSPWLKTYIELNTQFRTQAKNDFEKNLYKLMNNAVFGKTMENVRNRVDVKLLTKWSGRYGAEAMIAKPNFHSRSVFSENLVAIELRRLEVKFNKPIYVGMCILDISKVCLYEFHHDYMIPLYRDKCKIMYTDTDSLIYHLECDDIYKQMKCDIDRFDTSDYASNNIYGIPHANKKVPGLMKDENNGAIMTEFVGLRAKMYALRVEDKKDTKKAKGVKSNVVARTITFDDYVCCLREDIEMSRDQSRITSKLHNVYTVHETKIALSPYDDKRYIIPDSTKTLPWGHCSILL